MYLQSESLPFSQETKPSIGHSIIQRSMRVVKSFTELQKPALATINTHVSKTQQNSF